MKKTTQIYEVITFGITVTKNKITFEITTLSKDFQNWITANGFTRYGISIKISNAIGLGTDEVFLAERNPHFLSNSITLHNNNDNNELGESIERVISDAANDFLDWKSQKNKQLVEKLIKQNSHLKNRLQYITFRRKGGMKPKKSSSFLIK